MIQPQPFEYEVKVPERDVWLIKVPESNE